MSISAKSSSKKPRSFLVRINIRFPWLKLLAVGMVGIIAILDLLDLTISKTTNLDSSFPTAPMSKHVKATERDLKNKKLVALTFDDGPSPETTPLLLDILAAKDAVATFFVLGIMARSHPDIVQRAKNEGHEIASHTMYHQNLTRLSFSDVASDIGEANAVFHDILGYAPPFIRPPYGLANHNVYSASQTPLILWSVDPSDWQNHDPATIVEITMSQIHDGAVILMHDIYPTSVEATISIIDNLRAQGYEFATISELAKERGITLSPWYSYYHFAP